MGVSPAGGYSAGFQQFPKQPPPRPPSVRFDRKPNKATPCDPQQLRSRRAGYHTAWSAKRQEAAAAADSPNRVKAAAELKAHEKPQLYAVDVEQSEDLAHKFAAVDADHPGRGTCTLIPRVRDNWTGSIFAPGSLEIARRW